MLKIAQTALDSLDALNDAALEPDERDARLRAWPGWGPLAPAFDFPPRPEWDDFNEALAQRLDDDAISMGASVCNTSFYTPPVLTTLVYEVLAAFGITSGHLLDIGTGTGRFIDACPFDMDATGIEIDPTSAAMASALHPKARIINEPLQNTRLADGIFDAVVGNIPFSSQGCWDSANNHYGTLTEICVRRALDALSADGIAVLVTPSSVVDSILPEIGNADLLGMVRLPSGIFKAEGTQTSADIVVLRRIEGRHDIHGFDTRCGHDDLGSRTYVHHLWTAHPELVAGTQSYSGFHAQPLKVTGTDADVEAAGDALLALCGHYGALMRHDTERTVSLDDVVLTDDEGRAVGSFVLDGTTISQIQSDGSRSPVRASKELRHLISLRDAVLPLLDAEADRSTPDAVIEPLRAAALDAWRGYVDAFGPLNRGVMHEGALDAETGVPKMSWRRPRLGGFRADPAYLHVMAIENYDPETNTAEPSAILTRRVNVHPPRATHADSPAAAISIALAEFGRIDTERVAELLDMDTATARTAMLTERAAFIDPATNELVPARDYLSGNVRAKLAAAQAADLPDNIEALTEIQPPVIGAEDIDVRLGAPWVPVADIEHFSRDILHANLSISHLAATALWEVDDRGRLFDHDVKLAYGTHHYSPGRLLEHALMGKTPVVYDEVYSDDYRSKRRVRNAAATLEAIDKMRSLHEAFAAWVWSDDERRARLVATYDELFGGHVARTRDGSHLMTPGLADDVTLWDHQRAMVDMALSAPRVLCAHAVGAGKTLSAITTAMTVRRLGIANRPMIAVPGHLLEQIAREAQQAYPGARLLIATKDDLAGDSRRLFAARCATGDWDAVIMTHESLTSLPLSPHVEGEILCSIKADYAESLRHENEASGQRSGRTAKAMARLLATHDARMAQLRSATNDPNTVCFDHLGVDYLIVDEAHNFRRHPAAACRAEGFSMGASKRATDLQLKLDYLASVAGMRPHAMMMTGTPFVNTLAETFVWLTYLMPERLRRMGVHQFDAFAAMFVEYVTSTEVAPDGSGFRVATRPAAITNLPELMAMFDEVAYFLPSSELDLPRPDVRYHERAVERNEAQAEVMDDIVERARDLANGGGRDGDNMLVLCGLGRKVALDPALIDGYSDAPKLRELATTVADIYRERRDALQMVCMDQGTPKPDDSSSYGRARALMIEAGIPAKRIRFIHEATTDKQRAALFAACRNGEVSVLFGSTAKVGVGVNVQRNLVALHHADAAWTPADMEQREGRIIRYGNTNTTVDIYRYVTVGSFDAYMWQALTRKAKFTASLIAQAGVGITTRRVDDVNEVVMDYGQMLSVASGNPLLAELTSARSEARRLRTLLAVHAARTNGLAAEASQAERQAEGLDYKADRVETAPQVSREDIQAWSGVILAQLRASSRHSTLNLGPFDVSLSSTYDGETVEVSITKHRDYSTLGRTRMRATLLRRPRKFHEIVATEVFGHVIDPARSARDLRALAAKTRARAADLTRASQTVFEHAQRLVEVEADIKALEARMTVEAEAEHEAA